MTSMRWYRLLWVSSVSCDVEYHELQVVDLGKSGSFLEGPLERFDTIDVEDLHGTYVGVSTRDIILILGEHDIWTLVWRGELTRKEILVWTLSIRSPSLKMFCISGIKSPAR